MVSRNIKLSLLQKNTSLHQVLLVSGDCLNSLLDCLSISNSKISCHDTNFAFIDGFEYLVRATYIPMDKPVPTLGTATGGLINIPFMILALTRCTMRCWQ